MNYLLAALIGIALGIPLSIYQRRKRHERWMVEESMDQIRPIIKATVKAVTEKYHPLGK